MDRVAALWTRAVGEVKQRPLLALVSVSAAFVAVLEVRSSRANYLELLRTQSAVVKMVETSSTEMREHLRTTDGKFVAAMKQRDELIRRLQLQNVDQTKSVARLQAALRMCVRDPRIASPTSTDDSESSSVE